MWEIIFAAALAPPLPTGAALEKLYWDCDYASTVRMMAAGDAATCSVIYERFKAERFKGDWSAMYEYWKANKDREYKARAK